VVDGAYIGPYTSIGDEVRVINSEIEHSIVLSGSSVENLGARIEASLLGRDVKLTRSDSLPKTMRLLVGDRSEIEIV
jgi:glucose-1-phosphate thymidylyltransferase